MKKIRLSGGFHNSEEVGILLSDEKYKDLKKEEEKETEQRYDINIFGVPMTATKEELLNIQKQISNII